MKQVKQFAKIMLLLIFSMCFYSCIGPIPVDVVMVDNELFFVLEKKREIDFIRVVTFIDKNEKGMERYQRDNLKIMWLVGQYLTVPVKKRKYPTLKQIRYGQKFEEFPRVEGPFELQKNVEYSVRIDMGGKFADETFIITDDNEVIMPHPRFERQKERTYSVSIDKNGNKILVGSSRK